MQRNRVFIKKIVNLLNTVKLVFKLRLVEFIMPALFSLLCTAVQWRYKAHGFCPLYFGITCQHGLQQINGSMALISLDDVKMPAVP